MIFRTPVVLAAELDVIGQIEGLRKTLSYSVQARRWKGLLSRVTQARAIRGSNSIEGYHVTVQDAVAAVDEEAPTEAADDTWKAIVGYRNAMTYVLQLADDTAFAYSSDLIRGLHFMMTSYDLSRHPGRWRPGAVFVQNQLNGERVYEGPDVGLVPSLVGQLITALNDDGETPAMVRAAMAHLNLVMIHPFSDGNGRMARALQSLVLARQQILDPVFCSIEEDLGANWQAYYDVLARVGQGSWHPEGDARPWVRFCLAAHYRQATTLLRRSVEMAHLWDALETEIKQHGLPDRMIYALSDAAQGFRVTNTRYRSLADVTQNLASRDLLTLSSLRLLESKGQGRGRHYVAGVRTAQMFEATREPRQPIADPFDGSTNRGSAS